MPLVATSVSVKTNELFIEARKHGYNIDRESNGVFLAIEEHTVQLPDGQVIADWPWVVTPDFINVIAVTTDGKFLFFRQTKYSIPGTTLAPVGGYLEPGEDPLAAAQRELREETGYAATNFREPS